MSNINELEQKANNPKSATIDNQSVVQHDLSQQIEFDKYLEAKKVAKSKRNQVRFMKIRSGGSV